jgi:4-aminobutyrate aminotransferase-like enzyme
VGAFLLSELRGFVHDYSFVGDVRGRGLFLGLELVRSKKTREPLSRTVTRRIFDECTRRGLLTMAYAPSFRIQPALTIDRATAHEGVEVLREVFDRIEQKNGWEAA